MIQSTESLATPVPPPSDFAPADARPDFAPNSELPRHRWYRFKEGFSAGLVSTFAREYLPEEGGRLLDPFLGSGTTAVEGARLGHYVDGIETNPFIAFMAKVKTRDYSRAAAIEGTALECLRQRYRTDAFVLPRDSTLVERKGLDKWLLNRSVATRFEQLRTAIANVRPALVRDLLVLALLSSIEDVANARKDGKCWRYKSNWRKLDFKASSLDEAFAAQVIRFVEDIAVCPRLRGRATVVQGDAREHLGRVDSSQEPYDGVLTSPPYLNSFDYTDIYRPELLLLNVARNSVELREIRFNTLRSHVQVAWKQSAPLAIPLLHQKIRAIDNAGLWCGRIPEMINAYFVDLDRVIEQCSQRLKPGAVAGFVVADSAYCGVVIPVGLILSEIFERRGFVMKKITLFRQTRGNGNHQQRSTERLKEVMVVAEYRGACKRLVLPKSA
jgi:DNA modification methylase